MNQDLGPYNECFIPDVELEDGDIIELGNTSIRRVLTSGHTVGVMSHFWTMEHEGRQYHVGIYGGAGYLVLVPERLRQNGLPLSLREDCLTSIDKVWNEPVDIMLGNHPFHNETYIKYRQVKEGNTMAFVDETEWKRYLTELKDGYLKFLGTDPDDLKKMGAQSQWDQYYKDE